MADLTFIDSAYPLSDPPACDGVCIYLGGDAVHAWTLAEIGAQTARYRLPVYVRSNPPGPGAAQDVASALSRLKAIGAPEGTLVAWDAETSVDALYIRSVCTGLKSGGYDLIVYGSESTVMANDVPDGLYFAADWTGTPHLAPGSAMTQWVSFSGYDEDLAKASLPFWDARPPVPKAAPPAAKPTVPSWRQWTTAGEDSLHALASSHGAAVSTVLRETAQRSPSGEFPAEVASYLDAVFSGAADPAWLMPAGLRLWVPG
jgi:hypothetical protein